VFGEPPCGPWAGWTVNGLFLLNFVGLGLFPSRSRNCSLRLVLAYLLAVVEGVVSAFVWYFGEPSVSGYYF
jgi:hypothetical protein